MGIYSGPLNPVDGLVLYLDASNPTISIHRILYITKW